MHINYITALTVLSLTAPISGHAVWDNAIGDADPTCKGYVIGKRMGMASRKGTEQIPFQQDIPVLKNPIVPATKQSKWWGKPRTYWANGCGATIMDQDLWWSRHKDPKMRAAYQKVPAKNRNVVIYQVPVKQMLDWKTISTDMANRNQLIKVSPGGWIRIMHYQVNADGAGPLRCKISSTGQPNNWNPGWIYPPVKDQVPGGEQAKSVRAAGAMQLFPFTVTIPKTLKCNGSYGTKKNICMMRCENFAINGPFGGCIPFQLITPTAPPPPPPAPDNSDNIGKTTEADKVKLTDAEKAQVEEKEGPTEVSEAEDPEEDVKVAAENASTKDAAVPKGDQAQEEEAEDEDEDDDEEEETDKKMVKRQTVSDDEALKIAFGGEDMPPAIVKNAKAALKKVPASQKAKLNAKLAQGKAANKAAKKKGN